MVYGEGAKQFVKDVDRLLHLKIDLLVVRHELYRLVWVTMNFVS
jgi:hypothetical protein